MLAIAYDMGMAWCRIDQAQMYVYCKPLVLIDHPASVRTFLEHKAAP